MLEACGFWNLLCKVFSPLSSNRRPQCVLRKDAGVLKADRAGRPRGHRSRVAPALHEATHSVSLRSRPEPATWHSAALLQGLQEPRGWRRLSWGWAGYGGIRGVKRVRDKATQAMRGLSQVQFYWKGEV